MKELSIKWDIGEEIRLWMGKNNKAEAGGIGFSGKSKTILIIKNEVTMCSRSRAQSAHETRKSVWAHLTGRKGKSKKLL